MLKIAHAQNKIINEITTTVIALPPTPSLTSPPAKKIQEGHILYRIDKVLKCTGMELAKKDGNVFNW